MAVNVTQKDNALQMVIGAVRGLRTDRGGKTPYKLTEADRAYMRACDDVIALCERMLGYSSPNMPLEVPNRSEPSESLASAALKAERRATL